ncbi:MAG: M28 family metallopeptidase, partial [Pseudomonadota bacterium]
AITEADLRRHIEILASDEFEGRAPASPGGELTTQYLVSYLKEVGLAPAPNGKYRQNVTLVEMTPAPGADLKVKGPAGSLSFSYFNDVMLWTKRVTETAAIENSEIVFVGYGVHAPEYDWNDYEGVDVRGKTVLMLVNDPGFATRDPALFAGKTMTYYGRWTYKFEEAARQGAAGAIIIHEDEPASYPWDVVSAGWSGPQYDLERPDRNASRTAIEGWVTARAGREILALGGKNLKDLKARAAKRGFRAQALGVTASGAVSNKIRTSQSANIMGIVPGSEAPDEVVIFMAHWDHLGRGPAINGDEIYNGAKDNASGVAGILELIEAFQKAPTPPKRTVAFLAVTAEESGLLGSAHYAENPIFPAAKTVAAINLDGLNIIGPTREIVLVGHGKTTIEDILQEKLTAQGRRLDPEPLPERGYFYRSDHFSLAKVGIPVLYPGAGIDARERGRAWGLEQVTQFTQNHYHKPSDEYSPDWDLSGAVEDLQVIYEVGRAIADSASWPEWKPGAEFKAAREKSLSVGPQAKHEGE